MDQSKFDIDAAFEITLQSYAFVQGVDWNKARELAVNALANHYNQTICYASAVSMLNEIDREVRNEQSSKDEE